MAAKRLRTFETRRVNLSGTLRALIGGDRVVLYDQARGSFMLTLREAQVLGNAFERIDDDDYTSAGDTYPTMQVELSPSLTMYVGGGTVILDERSRGGSLLTIREARLLANAVGTTDKVNLDKTGSG